MTQTTLVAARADTGQTLVIGDTDDALLRSLSDQRLLTCTHCGGALTFKAGAVRLHHFAHVNLDACSYADHEPESDSHRLGKYVLYRHFRNGAREAALERHLPATDQRADCSVCAADGQGFALEFQQAANTIERWNERHRLYRSQNLCDLWFLGIVRYQETQLQPARPITPYDPVPVPRDVFEASAGGFVIRELEKAILAADDRLVYLDPETEALTILIPRGTSANTLRAYRYRLPLAVSELRAGALWTPLEPLLEDYHRFRNRQ